VFLQPFNKILKSDSKSNSIIDAFIFSGQNFY
jgi:hypothetical protein